MQEKFPATEFGDFIFLATSKINLDRRRWIIGWNIFQTRFQSLISIFLFQIATPQFYILDRLPDLIIAWVGNVCFSLKPPQIRLHGENFNAFTKNAAAIFVSKHTLILFQKWANPGLFYSLFLVFLKQTSLQFLQQIKWKNSMQNTVPGFEPTTFGTWVFSHNP